MTSTEILMNIKSAPNGRLCVLDDVKSKRFRAKTMYIPSVGDVLKVVRTIPKGEVRTGVEVRRVLAKVGKADTACPYVTLKYWKWLAALSEEASVPRKYLVAWWRVLPGGKPSRHVPGGVKAHVAYLKCEKVELSFEDF